MPPINLTQPWHVLHRWESQSKNKLSGFPSSCRTVVKAEMKHSWAPVSGDIRDQAEQISTQMGKITIDEEEHIHAFW